MKIALQIFTLMDYLKTNEDIINTLKRVKEIGYNAIQVSGVGQITKEKATLIKDECKKNGLEICATHASLEALQNEFDWVVEYHKMWNCKYVGIGMMPRMYWESEEKIVEFAQIMNSIAKRLKEHDITLLYHNHAFEFRKYNGKTGFDILFENFSKDVQFEIDTYWVQRGGASPLKWINKVKGKMDVIHFKDMGQKGFDEQYMKTVGAGNLDFDGIIEACINNGVKWACVEQDNCNGRDPFECITDSLNYLKSKGLS